MGFAGRKNHRSGCGGGFSCPGPAVVMWGVGEGCALKVALLLDTERGPGSVAYREEHVLKQSWRLHRKQPWFIGQSCGGIERDPSQKLLKRLQSPLACAQFPSRVPVSTVEALKNCLSRGGHP